MDRRTDATTPLATPATAPLTTPVTTVIAFEPRTPLGWLDDDELDDTVPLVPVPGCPCTVCEAFVSPWAIDRLELSIMDLVADLLDYGWDPESLVDEVDALSRRGPCAGQIVTLALVSHAGYWLSDPAMFDLLDEVDELAAGFHHYVGRTTPGWLDRYANADVRFGAALNGVADIFEILPMLPCASATPVRADGVGSAQSAWNRHRS